MSSLSEACGSGGEEDEDAGIKDKLFTKFHVVDEVGLVGCGAVLGDRSCRVALLAAASAAAYAAGSVIASTAESAAV